LLAHVKDHDSDSPEGVSLKRLAGGSLKISDSPEGAFVKRFAGGSLKISDSAGLGQEAMLLVIPEEWGGMVGTNFAGITTFPKISIDDNSLIKHRVGYIKNFTLHNRTG